MMNERVNSGAGSRTFGRIRNCFAILATVAAFAGLLAVFPAGAAADEKKLTKSEARLLVKNLDGEMSQVLYVVLAVPGVKEQRDAFYKRFKARGSMKGKTRKQVIDFYLEDVRAAYTDATLRNQIVEAINRYAESGR